jgi:cell division protein FtsB
MNRKFRYNLKKFFLPAFSVILFFYFIFHILSGDHGLFSWHSLETELDDSREVLSVLEREEKKLQNKIHLLRPESLDRDLLDERARDMLNIVEPQDMVIIDETIGA